MGRNKMIAKSCPKCEMQVAVASKSCKCGHTFFVTRRAADALPAAAAAAAVDDVKRRTGRVRQLPQLYDAQHYQKQIKRRSPKKRDVLATGDEDYKGKEKESAGARARRRRALRRATRPRPATSPPGGGAGGGRGRDAPPALTPAQLARCSLLLQEINRKMTTVTWQPPTD